MRVQMLQMLADVCASSLEYIMYQKYSVWNIGLFVKTLPAKVKLIEMFSMKVQLNLRV